MKERRRITTGTRIEKKEETHTHNPKYRQIKKSQMFIGSNKNFYEENKGRRILQKNRTPEKKSNARKMTILSASEVAWNERSIFTRLF